MGKQPAAGQKSKDAKLKAAQQSSKSKGAKSGIKKVDARVREKANLAVYLDKATFEKAKADVPKMKLITVSSVIDRLKVNGSIARKVIRYLYEQKLIKKVELHSSQYIFTSLKEATA